jgi:F-type H+-transporting ATPase subunit alpha
VWTETNAKEVLDTIRETGKLAEEADMNTAIEGFKKTFLPSDQK